MLTRKRNPFPRRQTDKKNKHTKRKKRKETGLKQNKNTFRA